MSQWDVIASSLCFEILKTNRAAFGCMLEQFYFVNKIIPLWTIKFEIWDISWNLCEREKVKNRHVMYFSNIKKKEIRKKWNRSKIKIIFWDILIPKVFGGLYLHFFRFLEIKLYKRIRKSYGNICSKIF